MNISELTEGLWYIKDIKDGKHISKVADKVEGLPEVMGVTSFLPIKDFVYKRLEALMRKKRREGYIGEEFTAGDILEEVEAAIKQGSRAVKKNESV